jgi:DNA invertase Pin-like site-specific DNA recombinase
MTLPFAGYTRVSRVGDRAERLISPDLQAERILGYAGGRGLEVELLEPELDVSGGRSERPVLGAAIDGIREGRYAGVIVAQLDRLSRMGIEDALKTIRMIEQDAGGQVIAVAENFDVSTPEGAMSREVMLSLANMQLKRYSLAFAAAKARAVAAGIWPAPKAPIGYKVTPRKQDGDGRLQRDPRAAPRVVRAFEARAAGRPWRAVAEVLGVGQSNAAKVIRNRAYLGEIHLGELVNAAAHEPLVDRALFEAAQLEHPRPARGSGPPALLAKLARCAGCRGLLAPNVFARGGPTYRCPAAPRATGRCEAPAIISQRKLDDYVTAIVFDHLEGIGYSGATKTSALEDAAAVLEDAEGELEAYQTARRVADVGAEPFAPGLRERVAAVQAARPALGRARASVPAVPDAGDLHDLWPELTIEEKRHVLRGALSVVWVRKGRGGCGERVRLIAAGSEPEGIPGAGGTATPVVPVEWSDVDLPGEIRPSSSENVEQSATGAGA